MFSHKVCHPSLTVQCVHCGTPIAAVRSNFITISYLPLAHIAVCAHCLPQR